MKYLLLQISYIISNLSDGIGIAAFPLILAQSGGTAIEIGVLAAFAMLPGLLIVLPAGAMVDRISSRPTMLWTSLIRAFLCLLFVILWIKMDNKQLLILQIGIVALASLDIVYDLAGPKMLTCLIKDKGFLVQANARLHFIETLGNRFIGGPLAGILASIGILLPILVIAPLYVIAAFVIYFIRYDEPIIDAKEQLTIPYFRFISDGFRFMMKSRVLMMMAFNSALCNLSLAGSSAIMVVFVTRYLNAPIWSFGLLYSCLAVGGAIGAIIAPKLFQRFGLGLTLQSTLLVLPILMGILAISQSIWVVGIQQVSLGLVLTVWGIGTTVYRQTVIPHELLGRVLSVNRFIVFSSMPIGSILGGYLVMMFGYHITFLIFALLLTPVWIGVANLNSKMINPVEEAVIT